MRAIADKMEPLLAKLQFAKLQEHAVMGMHLAIAETRENLQDWDGALDVYKWKAMAVFEYDSNDCPRNFTAAQQRRMFMGMSRCLYHKEDYDGSIQLGEEAIQMNRHFPQVHKYVALSQKANGDKEAAVQTMARAVHYETPWDDANKKNVLDIYENMKNDIE